VGLDVICSARGTAYARAGGSRAASDLRHPSNGGGPEFFVTI
jgi:hypothetical protein